MQSNDSPDWRAGFLAYVLIFLWIGVIFLLSSPAGSFSQTSRIIGPLLHFFFPDMPEATQAIVHYYVRKAAHFTEYAVLAFLVLRAFSSSSVKMLRKYRYILPIVPVAIIAVLDELNQSFEASRISSLGDIWLDISGGVAMLIFLWIISRPKMSEPPA